MTNSRTSIDVVVTHRCAHKFLNDVDLFVGAARGCDATNRLAAVFVLDFLETFRRERNRLFPTDLFPGIVGVVTNQRRQHPVAVCRVAPGKTTFHTTVAVISLAIFVRCHTHELVALHLGDERAAHAAVGAGRHNAVIRLAVINDALFHQCRGRAGLHACTAGNALGIEEVFTDTRRDFRLEAAALDRQRERALHLVAGAYTARAHDALARIELKVWITRVDGRFEVIFAVEPVTHIAKTDSTGHILQFAVAIGRAGQAVEWMVGDVQLHDVAPQPGERIRLCTDLHALFYGRRARGRVTIAALDFDEAHSAGTKWLDTVGGAQLGNIHAGLARGAQYAAAGPDRCRQAIDFDLDGVAGRCGRRPQIRLSDPVHASTPLGDAKSSAKYFKTLRTG